MPDALGAQTVTVIRRRRVKASDYADDTTMAPVEHPGCSVQPMGTEEQTQRGLTVRRRWRGFAPVGFTARAQDQVEVTPGPTTDGDAPLRLELDGPVEVWPDDDGSPHHVEFLLSSRDV